METITLTSGVNGYPESLRGAACFDTLAEARDYAARTGGELLTIRRQDGWQFWEVQDFGQSASLNSYTVDGWSYEDYDEALNAAAGDDAKVTETTNSYSYDVWHHAYAVTPKEED